MTTLSLSLSAPLPFSLPKQMLIKGVRSFSPDNTTVIEFYKPLTLIVGANGAGKTVSEWQWKEEMMRELSLSRALRPLVPPVPTRGTCMWAWARPGRGGQGVGGRGGVCWHKTDGCEECAPRETLSPSFRPSFLTLSLSLTLSPPFLIRPSSSASAKRRRASCPPTPGPASPSFTTHGCERTERKGRSGVVFSHLSKPCTHLSSRSTSLSPLSAPLTKTRSRSRARWKSRPRSSCA